MLTVGIVGGQDAAAAASRLRALGAAAVLGPGSAVAFRIATADTSGDTRFVDAVLTADEPVHVQVERLWSTRLGPWAEALAGTPAPRRSGKVQGHDVRWEWAGRRGLDRVRSTLKTLDPSGVFRYDHIGSTAVRGLAAKPFVDLQVRVARLPAPAQIDRAMSAIGFLPVTDGSSGAVDDLPHGAGTVPDDVLAKRTFLSPDPVSPTIVHVRRLDSPWGRNTVWFRDWLKAHPEERDRYEQVKIKHGGDADPDDYTRAKSAYFNEVHEAFEEWARRA